ncbi:MAG: hypothetical protein DBY37_11255 [Desulfovibrionaceae bacterium]|nr:MAG: hypothetical protein DBY37_11255 [Desulfovibrionaceae bacterium]
MTQNASYFVSCSFAEKHVFRLIHGGLHSETSDISALWSISPMKCPAESNGAGRRRNPLAASSSDGGVKPAGRNPGDSPADILKCKTL